MLKQFLVIMLLGLALFAPVQATQNNIYGPIDRNDTLWEIATQLRPSKQVSIQQTIIAIYEKNKHAFTVNNINSLRKGAHMLAPTLDEVRALNKKGAIARVQRHNQRWKKGRYVAIHNPVPAELKAKLAGTDKAVAVDTNAKDTETAETKTTETPTEATQQASQTTISTAESPDSNEMKTSSAAEAVPETLTDDMPLKEQLAVVKQELIKAREENDLLKTELSEVRQKQQQTIATTKSADPEIQAQLDTLRHELTELRTILTQKDNHIQTLQASLKSASEAIKSQHADNMRLYNKLKELSPGSLPAQAKNAPGESTKPHIKLAAVSEPESTADTIASLSGVQPGDESNKVWADEITVSGEAGTATQSLRNATTQPANAVKTNAASTTSSGSSIPLSQLLNGKTALTQPSTLTPAGKRTYQVSPIAWAAVILSFIFIVFLVIRALMVQNEMRKFGNEITAD